MVTVIVERTLIAERHHRRRRNDDTRVIVPGELPELPIYRHDDAHAR